MMSSRSIRRWALLGLQGGGLLSGEDAQAMDGVFDGGFQRRDGGQRGFELGARAGGVEFGGASGLGLRDRYVQGLALVVRITTGHRQLVLGAAQLEVVAGDF